MTNKLSLAKTFNQMHEMYIEKQILSNIKFNYIHIKNI